MEEQGANGARHGQKLRTRISLICGLNFRMLYLLVYANRRLSIRNFYCESKSDIAQVEDQKFSNIQSEIYKKSN